MQPTSDWTRGWKRGEFYVREMLNGREVMRKVKGMTRGRYGLAKSYIDVSGSSLKPSRRLTHTPTGLSVNRHFAMDDKSMKRLAGELTINAPLFTGSDDLTTAQLNGGIEREQILKCLHEAAGLNYDNSKERRDLRVARLSRRVVCGPVDE